MKVYKYIKMHVEKYLFEIIKESIQKAESMKICKMYKKCM